MSNLENKPFHTSDTPLAVYLIIGGIELTELNTSTFPAIFRFTPDSNGKINDLIAKWGAAFQGKGEATGDCVAFFRTYRSFIRKIKDAQIPYNPQKS